MSKKRLIQTVIETVEVVRIHLPAGAPTVWCTTCRADVPAVTLEQSALLRQVSVREIHRLIEIGTIHVVDLSGITLEVCPISLGFREASQPTLPGTER